MKPIDVDAVKKFIDAQSIDTRIYLGCDSERVKLHNGWWADYTLAVVVTSMATADVKYLAKYSVNVITTNVSDVLHCV